MQSPVVICFQFSIFEPLDTTRQRFLTLKVRLWFAFNLVSLNHWTQRYGGQNRKRLVVICFQFSIFEPLDTTWLFCSILVMVLWFAFNLVSLNHWTQHEWGESVAKPVVICFQFSIFEPLDTTHSTESDDPAELWFAFNLVSLNHWTQRVKQKEGQLNRCDLLSI